MRSRTREAHGRRPRPLTALALAGLVASTVAGPGARSALANHEEACPPYTSTTSVEDEIRAESIVIGVELVHNILATAAAFVEQAEEPAPDPADTALEQASKPFKIAAAVASGVQGAAKGALLGLQIANKIADECRIGKHWELLDSALSSAIRRDLAATTTPVASFVLPESAGGWIDVKKFGVKAVVDDSIRRMEATGQCSCASARAYYNQAVIDMNSGKYKAAYTNFRRAYVLSFS